MKEPILAAFALLVAAQAAGQAPPAFEVADVHVSPRSSNPSIQPFDSAPYAARRMKGGLLRGGLYFLRTATMVDLIATAWGIEADNIKGGPDWLDLDRFDVIARAPADATPEAVRPMLQSLLTERFQLVLHTETKPLPAYVLTAGKRLQPRQAADRGSASGCRSHTPKTGKNEPAALVFTTTSCQNVTMASFAEALRTMAAANIGNVPVFDKTGLQGSWDFSFYWTARDLLASAGSEGVSFFEALDRQLGLRLERQQMPMPVVVIDRVNRTPAANPPDIEGRLPVVPTEFEVAEVKPSLAGEPEGGGVMPGGRIDMRGNTMKDFIKFAWNIDDREDDTLVGGPKWLDVDRFDIVARASTSQLPSGELVDVDALRPMMKALLAERFKLRVHTGEEAIEVYAIEASGRSALKLAKADRSRRSGCRNTVDPAPASQALTRHFECHNVSMAQFADQLRDLGAGYMDHAAIDATGLEGWWDFAVSFSPRKATKTVAGARTGANGDEGQVAAAPDPTGAVTFFEALDKQAGLKLRLRKRRMPVLVIDHVEQRPTEN